MENANNKITFSAFVTNALNTLKELKQKDDRIEFDKIMEKILPNIKQYLGRHLNIAVKTNAIPAGKYNVEDFMDELYLKAYEHIQEVNGDDKHLLYSWMFKKADELLEEAIVDEEFDATFFKDIDDYSKAEWKAMEENYTRDGYGDFVMEEELDDISYAKNDYTLASVFIEDKEQEIIEQISKKTSPKEIHRHIYFVLHHLPVPVRTIFELNLYQQFAPNEIAEIKRIPVSEVEMALTSARRNIMRSFVNKYLNQ